MSERKKYSLVATTFDKKGRVLSSAFNDYKRSHPLGKHFALIVGESEHKDKIHAELGAVLKAGKNVIHSVLVQRFNKDGSMACAKPCKACSAMLEAFGVRIVKYTTEEGIKQYEIQT